MCLIQRNFGFLFYEITGKERTFYHPFHVNEKRYDAFLQRLETSIPNLSGY